MQFGSAWVLILLGMLGGSCLGIFLSLVDSGKELSSFVEWISLPGSFFLGLLQMVMVPLVVSSVAVGIAKQGENESLGKLASLSIGCFFITTALSILIGLGVHTLIRPGQSAVSGSFPLPIDVPMDKVLEESRKQSIPTILESTFPSNPFRAFLEANMLSVVVFSVVFGAGLSRISREKGSILVEILESILEFAMVVVGWALQMAPVAVFCLMTRSLYNMGWELLPGLGMYVLTVLLGLGLVLCLFFVLGFVLGKVPPVELFLQIRELLVLAFSASSSAAVLPVSLQTAIRGLGVRAEIADFVIPLGATIHMSGTALYQGIATLFLAEIYGVHLSASQLVLLVFTVVGASVGTAATPGVGIVVLAGIVSSFGIPREGIALLFGVDRILDMCRTAVNVTGDVVVSKIADCLLEGRISNEPRTG